MVKVNFVNVNKYIHCIQNTETMYISVFIMSKNKQIHIFQMNQNTELGKRYISQRFIMCGNNYLFYNSNVKKGGGVCKENKDTQKRANFEL